MKGLQVRQTFLRAFALVIVILGLTGMLGGCDLGGFTSREAVSVQATATPGINTECITCLARMTTWPTATPTPVK